MLLGEESTSIIYAFICQDRNTGKTGVSWEETVGRTWYIDLWCRSLLYLWFVRLSGTVCNRIVTIWTVSLVPWPLCPQQVKHDSYKALPVYSSFQSGVVFIHIALSRETFYEYTWPCPKARKSHLHNGSLSKILPRLVQEKVIPDFPCRWIPCLSPW